MYEVAVYWCSSFTHSVQVTVGCSFLAVAETVELEFIT